MRTMKKRKSAAKNAGAEMHMGTVLMEIHGGIPESGQRISA